MVALKITKLTEQFLLRKDLVWLQDRATRMNIEYTDILEANDLVQLILKAQDKPSSSRRTRSGKQSDATNLSWGESISQVVNRKGKAPGIRSSPRRKKTASNGLPATRAHGAGHTVTSSPPDELAELEEDNHPVQYASSEPSQGEPSHWVMPQSPVPGKERRTLGNKHDIPRKSFDGIPDLRNRVGTPETSPENTPEPPEGNGSGSPSAKSDRASIEEIERTYHIILEMAQQNDELEDQLNALDAIVTSVEDAVPEILDGVHMNEENRMRLEAFAMSWKNIGPRTAWETLWGTEQNGYLLYHRNGTGYEIDSDDGISEDGPRIKEMLNLEEVERDHDSEIGEVEIQDTGSYWDELSNESSREEEQNLQDSPEALVYVDPPPVMPEPRSLRSSQRQHQQTAREVTMTTTTRSSGTRRSQRTTVIGMAEVSPTSQKRRRGAEPEAEVDGPSEETRYQPRRKLRPRKDHT